ncbi:uncharacterized protein LOC141902216 [Tubulanus polymorphus]|uniref:uncharacterized protein LOC141902216 n=1 Tax=Tubulanus polymorphus TaxID=672921 RepID=UPI003DA29C03
MDVVEISKVKVAVICYEPRGEGAAKICTDGLREEVKECYEFMNIIRSADEDIFDFTERCIDIVKSEQITGVLGLRDIAAIISAAICERLPHIPGPSLKSVAIALHKYYTRLYFAKEQGGINYRLLWYDASPTEIHAVLNQVGFPCFVKPCSGTLSVGAMKIESADDFRGNQQVYDALKVKQQWERFNEGFLSKVGAPCPEDALIVEEFEDFDAFLAVMGLVANGQIINWAMFDLNFWKTDPLLLSSLSYPSKERQDIKEDIWKTFDIVVRRMIDHGFNNQFVFLEIVVMKDGNHKIIEVNHRIATESIPMFRACLDNGDCFDALLKVSQGIVPKAPTPNGRSMMIGYLSTFATDKVGNLIDLEAMKCHPEVQLWYKPEDQVKYPGGGIGSFLGFVCVSAPTYKEQYDTFLKIAKDVMKQPEYSVWE